MQMLNSGDRDCRRLQTGKDLFEKSRTGTAFGMESPHQKSFCVLEFAKLNSAIMVQRSFRRKFNLLLTTFDAGSSNSKIKEVFVRGKVPDGPCIAEPRPKHSRDRSG